MKLRTGFSKATVMVLLTAAMALVTACSGISQADMDAAKQAASAAEQKAASLQQQLTAKAQEAASAQQQLQASKTQGAGQNVVLFAKPNAPPRATPTPAPPGFVAPPPPQPPTAAVVPIAFYVDTVTAGPGESKYNIDANVGCARTGVFKRGMHVVWRMSLIDTSTGKVLQGADVERATVKLPNGATVALRYGRHGAFDQSPWFWATGWDIPLDYPLGVLDYTIEVVTKTGKTGTFKEMNTVPSPGIVSPQQSLTIDKLGTINAGLIIVE